VDLINLLVKSYPESVKVRDRHGTLPLYQVLQYKFDDSRLLVKLFLDSWPESIVQHDKDGSLPLREVLTSNFCASLAAINVLAKTKPNILRVQDVDGFSPLHLALHCPIRAVDAAEYLQLIKLLVESWPESLQIKTTLGGMLPLHLACKIGRAYTNIIWYIFHSNPQAVRVQDDRLRFPLHLLCARRSVCKRLVQRFVQEWPASVQIAGRYSKKSTIFTMKADSNDGIAWKFSGVGMDNLLFMFQMASMKISRDDFDDMVIREAEEEYDGDDNGWEGDSLEHNKECKDPDQEHYQHKDTHSLNYHSCQNDNEDLDESQSQQIDSTVSNDQYGKIYKNDDYIYALPLDVACYVRKRPSLELL